MSEREECRQGSTKPTADFFHWDADGDELIVGSRCGLAFSLKDMSNDAPVHIAPIPIKAGISVGNIWRRCFFGVFPKNCSNPKNPVLANGHGEFIRYRHDRSIPGGVFSLKSTTRFIKEDVARRIEYFSASSVSSAAFAICDHAKSTLILFTDITNFGKNNVHVYQIKMNVSSISLSRQGKYLSFGTKDGKVSILERSNFASGNFTTVAEVGSPITSMSWSSCDTVLGYCVEGSPNVPFHVLSGGTLPPIPQHDAYRLDVGSHAGKVAVRTRNGEVVVWSSSSGLGDTGYWNESTRRAAASMEDFGEIVLRPDNRKVIIYNPGARSIEMHSA